MFEGGMKWGLDGHRILINQLRLCMSSRVLTLLTVKGIFNHKKKLTTL